MLRDKQACKADAKCQQTLDQCENWLSALRAGTKVGTQVQVGMLLTEKSAETPAAEVKSIRHWDGGHYTTEEGWSEGGLYVELVDLNIRAAPCCMLK